MFYFDSATIIFNDRHSEMVDFLNLSIAMKTTNKEISRTNEHILKSNIVLMQYNILESSFLELYKSLYNYLKDCTLSVDTLNNFFTYNIYSIIKRSANKKHEIMKDKLINSQISLNFSSCAMSICFDLDEEEKKFLINGNIDGRKIKEFLENFGIDISPLNELELADIKTLKDNRQLLAHGGSSFSEVGRGISWETLQYNVNTIELLFITAKKLLENFCNHLDQEMISKAS